MSLMLLPRKKTPPNLEGLKDHYDIYIPSGQTLRHPHVLSQMFANVPFTKESLTVRSSP
jgi:hypothetical protein